MIWLLLKTDLKRLFVTPQAWIMFAIGQLVLAWAYFSELENYEQLQHKLVAVESELGVTQLVLVPVLLNALNIIMLLTPLLSMRLIASERQSQRFDLLLASPLKTSRVMLAKYFQLMLVLGGFWSVVLLQIMLLQMATQPDIGKLLLIWGMGWLVISLYSAVGLWLSCLTLHPLVAAVGTYGMLILLRIAGAVKGEDGLLDWFSITHHLTDAQLGLFNSSDLIYFVLMSGLFLSLSWIRLASFRRRQYIWPARFLMMGLLVGLVVSWPLLNQFEYKIDVSDQKQNSLTHKTRQLLDRLQDSLSFTVYVEQNSLQKKQLERLLNRFAAYKQDVVIRYVDPGAEAAIARELGITGNGEILVRYAKRQQLVKRVREKDIVNTLQQMLQRDNGWILNVQGHGELDLSDKGRFGASQLTSSLRARGYKIRNYNLAELGSLPANTDLLIIGAPKNAFTQLEQIELNKYLKAGGNLLWLFEPDQKGISKLAGLPEIGLFPGVVVDATAAEFKLQNPTDAVVTHYDKHAITRNLQQFSMFPQSAAFEVLDQNQWSQQLSLETGPKSWNETGEIKGEIDRDPVLFEQQGPLQLAAFWEKAAVGNDHKRQKLAVFGDSDFLRNSTLGKGDNLALTLNLFFWFDDSSALQETTHPTVPDQQVIMSDSFRGLYGGFFLFGLPALLLLAGLLINWQSRRR